MIGLCATLGAQGGLAAGALVGLAEAVTTVLLHPGLEDVYVVPAAILGYGVLGLALGLPLGVLVGLVGRAKGSGRWWAPSLAYVVPFAVLLSGLSLVVGRFRLVRDLLAEQPPPVVLDLAFAGALLTVALSVVAVGEWLFRRHARVERWAGLGTVGVAGLLALTLAIAYPLSRPPSGRGLGVTAPGAAERPSLLLVAVDTLRADRLSTYGYTAARTPAIDRLAQDGILFANPIAQASWTKPSFASLFTSLYPSGHQTFRKADALPDGAVTLAEALVSAGYHTAAFVNNPNLSPAFNFQQGFVEYHYLSPAYFFFATESVSHLALYGGLRMVRERFFSGWKSHEHYYRDAREVTDHAIRWLEAGPPQPFLLLLHYMDPHDPYFVHPYNGEAVARVQTPRPDPAQARRISALYDGEVAYLDEHLGRLFDHLRRRGLYDRVAILLTADHGEEFFEHGGWWHGTTLYDEQIRVPLIVKLPGGRMGGRRVEEQVRLIDVAPTLLAAASLPAPPTMQGRSLIAEGLVGSEAVFAEEDFEGNQLRAVRRRDGKLIEAAPGNPRGLKPTELYQLERDPGEQQDLAATEPGRTQELRGVLDRLAGEAQRNRPLGGRGPLRP